MKKSTYLKEIQKRLPEDLIIEDETNFEYTEDEYVCILSWLRYFNDHYKTYKKEKLPEVIFPIISKRLRLDFGLYHIPCDIDSNRGKFIIYISPNGNFINGKFKEAPTTKSLINTWNL